MHTITVLMKRVITVNNFQSATHFHMIWGYKNPFPEKFENIEKLSFFSHFTQQYCIIPHDIIDLSYYLYLSDIYIYLFKSHVSVLMYKIMNCGSSSCVFIFAMYPPVWIEVCFNSFLLDMLHFDLLELPTKQTWIDICLKFNGFRPVLNIRWK